MPLQCVANSPQVFLLDNGAVHHLTSALYANGTFQFYLDGKLVARGIVPAVLPLAFPPTFEGKDLPSALPQGMAGVIIGPLDEGVNRAEQVYFGLIGDPDHPVHNLESAEKK